MRGTDTKETGAYLTQPSLDSPFGPQVCLWRLAKRQLGSGRLAKAICLETSCWVTLPCPQAGRLSSWPGAFFVLCLHFFTGMPSHMGKCHQHFPRLLVKRLHSHMWLAVTTLSSRELEEQIKGKKRTKEMKGK